MIEDIVEDGSSYDFFQAVRLINRLGGANGSSEKTVLKIRPDLNLDYPQSDITEINRLDDGKGYEILATFMGLYGVSSPLPGYFTEELLDDEWDEQFATREFFDVIHFHLYPLLYDAWLKYRFSLNAVERSSEKYWDILYSLMGLGAEFRQDKEFSARLLKYAGLFSHRTKSLLGLKTILNDFADGVDIDIEPCIERKVDINTNQRCCLGKANTTLSEDAVIGVQVGDRSGKYRIVLGPLTHEQFQHMKKESSLIQQLRKIIAHYLVQPLYYEIVLKLEAGAASPVQLGNPEQSSLGVNTWMIEKMNNETYDVCYI